MMRKTAKILAILLSVAMVVCAFCATLAVSAEEETSTASAADESTASEATTSDASEATTSDASEATTSDASEATTSDASEATTSDASEATTSDASEAASADESEASKPESVNLAAGKSYTYEHFDAEGKAVDLKTVDDKTGIDKEFAYLVFLKKGCSDNNGTGGFLTDGKVRTSKLLDGSGDGGANTSVELVGTFTSHAIDIDLGGACSVNAVVLGTARRGGNRYVNVVKLEVKVNGAWQTVQFVETTPLAAQIAADEDQTVHQTHGKDLEGKETGPADQYFDITLSFDAIANVTNVKVTIDTNYGETPSEAIQLTAAGRSYVAQLDEIQVMGVAGASGDVSVDASAAETSEASTATSETSQSGNTGTDKTGDAGVIAFAVLAVISGAAVVVLKKRA